MTDRKYSDRSKPHKVPQPVNNLTDELEELRGYGKRIDFNMGYDYEEEKFYVNVYWDDDEEYKFWYQHPKGFWLDKPEVYKRPIPDELLNCVKRSSYGISFSKMMGLKD